jgi:hypothetical protein
MEQTIKTWAYEDEKISLDAKLHDILISGAYTINQVIPTRFNNGAKDGFNNSRTSATAAIIVLNNVTSEDKSVDELQTEAALEFLRNKGFIITKPSK